jgi:hypothetical protein
LDGPSESAPKSKLGLQQEEALFCLARSGSAVGTDHNLKLGLLWARGLHGRDCLGQTRCDSKSERDNPKTQEHRHASNVSFEQYSAKADIEDTHECSCCKRCIAERYLYDLEKAKGGIRLVDNTKKVGRDCDRHTQSATGA